MLKRMMIGLALVTLTACSPAAIAGPQIEAAFYSGVRAEMQKQGLSPTQIDCIEADLRKNLTAQDIIDNEKPQVEAKIKQVTQNAVATCASK